MSYYTRQLPAIRAVPNEPKETSAVMLYSISDHDASSDDIVGWWTAIWARSPDKAIALALQIYDGSSPNPVDALRITSVENQGKGLVPILKGTYVETDREILRLAGWRSQDEKPCIVCGLYAVDNIDFSVCEECGMCPDCKCFDNTYCMGCNL